MPTPDRSAPNALMQARRARELLESALSVLREDGALEAQGAEVVDRLERARARLTGLDPTGDTGFGEAVLASTDLLAGAVDLARHQEALPPRHSQSMEAVTRSLTLLHPIAARHGWTAPPPSPWTHAYPEPSEEAARPDDRRRHPRVELESEVTFESDNNFYTGFAEDISEGGLFVATYQLQARGTDVEIRFTLPDGHVVHTVGVVRWLRDPLDANRDAPPGMGVQFEHLLEEDRRAIQQFIQARAPLFYDD
jgi:uncharacterized protein (TIGR02266 family)